MTVVTRSDVSAEIVRTLWQWQHRRMLRQDIDEVLRPDGFVIGLSQPRAMDGVFSLALARALFPNQPVSQLVMTFVAAFRVLVPLSLALTLANAAPAGAADVAPFEVPAFAETVAVQQTGDAADDAEIWRNDAHPEQSRIFATDKKSGLMVLDLAGKVVEFFPIGRVNNVDLRSSWSMGGENKVLVAASDRTKLGISFFVLDPKTLKVTALAGVLHQRWSR